MSGIALFSDLHMGHHNDAPFFNSECVRFIDWMLDLCKENEVEEIIFLGDFFHSRTRLRVDTMDMAVDAVRKLTEAFPVTMIVGNHDMFYRDSREVVGIEVFRPLGVNIIKDIEQVGDITFVPFLVGDEHLDLQHVTTPFVLGHLEMANFQTSILGYMMDDAKVDPDSIQPDVQRIISGHYHHRQTSYIGSGAKVTYLGAPFAHNFSDVGDRAKGFAIWYPGQEDDLVFYDFDGPWYERYSMSELLEDESIVDSLDDRAHIELVDDLGDDEISEEIIDILTPLVRQVRVKTEVEQAVDDENIVVDISQMKSVDEIVLEGLGTIQSKDGILDPEILKKQYLEA